MARVTVEDCIDKVANRFELVLIAAQRTKAVNSGVPITVERDNDKDPVIALREIAQEHVQPAMLIEDLIQSLQTRSKVDQIEDDNLSFDDEDMDDKFDYMANGADIYVSDDHSDLDGEHIFGKDETDLEDKGF